MTLIPVTPKMYLGTPTGDELVLNPGFETAGAGAPDVFASWTEVGGGVLDEVVIFHGGAHACELPNYAQSITQKIDSERSLFRLTFWTRSIDGIHAGEVRVHLSHAVSDDIEVIPRQSTGITDDTAWHQLTYYFWGQSNAWDINITFYGGSGGCYIDDVSLVDMWDYDYAELPDVMGAVEWQRGMASIGPLERVAGSGSMEFTLDNSAANSGGLDGLYSPGHTNCLAGWELGAAVYLTLDDGGGEVTVFHGWVDSIIPEAGLYSGSFCQVRALDLMNQLTALEFPAIPAGADVETGTAVQVIIGGVGATRVRNVEFIDSYGETTLASVYDTDYVGDSVLSFVQKMALHEMGRVYARPTSFYPGVQLAFEDRTVRPENQTPAFVLSDAVDHPASDLAVVHNNADLVNIVEAVIYPYSVGTSVELHSLKGTLEIQPEQEIELVCPFTDPETGRKLAAVDVVNPVTDYEFGALNNFVSDTHHDYLSQDNTVGATSMTALLTNLHKSQTLYLNDFFVTGLPVYRGDGVTLYARDEGSVLINGPRRLKVRLQQFGTMYEGQRWADWLLRHAQMPGSGGIQVSFFACRDAALTAAAIDLDISDRFTLIESLTGTSGDYFVEWLAGQVVGQWLYVTIGASPATITDYMLILDTGHLDDDTDGRLYL